MKLKFFITIVFSLFIGFSFFIPPAKAATSCDQVTSISVSPTSGTTSTKFHASGQIQNCSSTQLRLVTVDPGNPTVFAAILNNFTTDANGNFDIPGILFPTVGQWFVRVYSDITADFIPQNKDVVITVNNSSTGGTTPQLNCGDTITMPPPIPNSICPPNCPPNNATGTWVCSGAASQSFIQNYCQDPANKNAPQCAPSGANGQFCRGNNGPGIETAIGCVPTSFDGFFKGIIKYGYALGGGIALLLMIIGAFQMLTSGGNPESIKKGREQFIAASTGLLFIILSTVLLHIIGVDILGTPGF